MPEINPILSTVDPSKNCCHVLKLKFDNEVYGAPNINVDGKVVLHGKDGEKYVKYLLTYV